MSRPDDVVIRVEHLGKRYRIGSAPRYHALRDAITATVASRLPGRRRVTSPGLNEIWALDDVAFTVREGEVLGVIGRNGAGKSTLLKLLARITRPTRGSIAIRGRVASLLEVGTGFHPELTGRENIFLNGAILGMTRAEIARKLDEIVAFAEVEKFVDTPVKHYSSGMYLRLAFAIAAHLEPEILLVDEVLAVGDAAFQKKCTGKMGDVAKGGRTVLFVSHNIGAITTLCSHAAYLVAGRLAAFGPAHDVAMTYTRDTAVLSGASDLGAPSVSRRGDGAARFVRATLQDLRARPIAAAIEGTPFRIELRLEVRQPIDLRILSITLIDPSGNDLATTMHYDTLAPRPLNVGAPQLRTPTPPLAPGLYAFGVTFEPNTLRAGTFDVRLACFGPNFHEHDHLHHAFAFTVARAADDPDDVIPRPGVVKVEAAWQMTRLSP
jgi:lipopolysaccharide transport system ATP-binding protein